MYGACLKRLDRPEDFVRVSLMSLSKAIKLRELHVQQRDPHLQSNNERNEQGRASAREIVTVSAGVATAIRVPMTEFFCEIKLDSHVQHLSSEDGFSLEISFRSKLEEVLDHTQLHVKLMPISDTSHGEIILGSKQPLRIPNGAVNTTVSAQV